MALRGQRLKYPVNMLPICILYCDDYDLGPGSSIRAVRMQAQFVASFHKLNNIVYLCPAFLQRLS